MLAFASESFFWLQISDLQNVNPNCISLYNYVCAVWLRPSWHICCRYCTGNVQILCRYLHVMYRYLHAYEDFNRKLGCTLVTTSQHSRRMPFRERTDRPLDVTGRRPSSLKDEPQADSKPSADIKEEVRLLL